VLLEAHLHALVLELADYRVLAKAKQFLRVANDEDVQAGLPMMDGVLNEISTKVGAAKVRILAAAHGAFAAELANVRLHRSRPGSGGGWIRRGLRSRLRAVPR